MATENGTPNNDTLQGPPGEPNTINGFEGNDALTGGIAGFVGTDDVIDGGDGNDTIDGANGSDTLLGGSGDDQIVGGPGGGGQNEDDFIDGGPGADFMSGQAGADIYIVDNPGDVVQEFSQGEIEEVRSSISVGLKPLAGDGFAENFIENLTLIGAGDIDGTGNDVANLITGNDGDNMLSGGVGDDTLEGRLGDDTIEGDEGSDTFIVGMTRGDATVGFDADTVVIVSSQGTDRIDAVESFVFLEQTIARGDLMEDPPEPDPELSISAVDPSVTESLPLRFEVTRAGASDSEVSVDYTVSGSGMNAASAIDFPGDVFAAGTVTFTAGGPDTITIDLPTAGSSSRARRRSTTCSTRTTSPSATRPHPTTTDLLGSPTVSQTMQTWKPPSSSPTSI